MQGAGNDFIIIDNRNKALSKQQIIAFAPKLCDRHFGIGADGIITLESSKNRLVDYTMFYRNADGSDAGMCGNGARCLALFAAKNGFDSNLSFNVHNTIYEARVEPKNQVEITFPVSVEINEVNTEDETVFKLHTGTEHIVLQLSDAELRDSDFLMEKGRKLREEPKFNPPGTNVNFIHGTSKNTLILRTYEKGVEGLTLACGTGAIASALAWNHIQKINPEKRLSTIVQTDGGTLQVGFRYNRDKHLYSDITLSGEARFVYEGMYEL